MIKGKDLIVYLNGSKIAVCKSCKINISQDFIKVCSPTGGRTMDKIPTIYDWGVSVDCLVSTSSQPNDLIDKLIAGTKVLLTFTDGRNMKRAGFVYVKSCDEGGNIGNLASFSASFESSGPLYYCSIIDRWWAPQEAQGAEFYFNSFGLNIRFRQTGMHVEMADILRSSTGKLAIFTNSIWAIYNEREEYILSWLDREDNQSLDEHAIAYGQGDGVFNYNNTSYEELYILCNSPVASLIFLYE